MEGTHETSSAADAPLPDGRATKRGRLLLGSIGPISSGYDALRMLLAGLLLTAAGLKAYQLSTEPTLGTGFLDSRWVLIATVEFELLFGLCLLANVLPKLTWAASLGCFGLFTCISLCKALSGHASCGCFGRVEVNPWYTTSLDLTIVLSLLCWRPRAVSPRPSGEGQGEGCTESKDAFSSVWSLITHHSSFIISRRASAVMLLWFCIGLPAAFAMGSYTDTTLSDVGDIIGDGKIVVLEPEGWLGKRFPLSAYIDIGNGLQFGKWIVVLHRHDCWECQVAMPKYRQAADALAGRSGSPRVVLVEMPPYADTVTRRDDNERQLLIARLSDAHEWFAKTPIELAVTDGIVTFALEGGQGLNWVRKP